MKSNAIYITNRLRRSLPARLPGGYVGFEIPIELAAPV